MEVIYLVDVLKLASRSQLRQTASLCFPQDRSLSLPILRDRECNSYAADAPNFRLKALLYSPIPEFSTLNSLSTNDYYRCRASSNNGPPCQCFVLGPFEPKTLYFKEPMVPFFSAGASAGPFVSLLDSRTRVSSCGSTLTMQSRWLTSQVEPAPERHHITSCLSDALPPYFLYHRVAHARDHLGLPQTLFQRVAVPVL